MSFAPPPIPNGVPIEVQRYLRDLTLAIAREFELLARQKVDKDNEEDE